MVGVVPMGASVGTWLASSQSRVFRVMQVTLRKIYLAFGVDVTKKMLCNVLVVFQVDFLLPNDDLMLGVFGLATKGIRHPSHHGAARQAIVVEHIVLGWRRHVREKTW
jgi:hypothetical protein